MCCCNVCLVPSPSSSGLLPSVQTELCWCCALGRCKAQLYRAVNKFPHALWLANEFPYLTLALVKRMLSFLRN